MELIKIGFNDVINVGSSESCSKYDFGIELAKQFGFINPQIKKKSIADHKFTAQRNSDLSLDISKISNLNIDVPDWRRSIIQFNHDNPNLIQN